MMMGINEEKILKMVMSDGKFIEEDFRITGRALLMMSIYCMRRRS
jgi:hypothetical protein